MRTRSGNVSYGFKGQMMTRSGRVFFGYLHPRSTGRILPVISTELLKDSEEVSCVDDSDEDSDDENRFFVVKYDEEKRAPPSIITVFPFSELVEKHIVAGTNEWQKIDVDGRSELNEQSLRLRVFFGDKWSDPPFDINGGLLLRVSVGPDGTVGVAHVDDLRVTIGETLTALKIAFENEFFQTRHFRAIEIKGALALAEKKWADFVGEGVHTLSNPLVVALRS